MSSPSPTALALHAVGGVGHGTVPRGALVRLLVRLKWTLWKRSFRKNIGKVIGTCFGVLYGLGGLVGLAAALMATALLVDGVGPDVFGIVVRGLGALTVLVWLVVPLFAFGLDDTLDPRRFATLPRSAGELQGGLFAAAALSLPSLFTLAGVLIASVCEAIWLVTSAVPDTSGMIGALVLLVPANLLGLILCLLLPRAILAQSATRQSSRRGRELGGILAMVLMFAVIYGASLLGQSLGEGGTAISVRLVADVIGPLAWTPLGAAFAVPVDVAEGQTLVGIARLMIALVTVALVWLWWRRSIGLTLRSALLGEASSGSAKVTALVPRGLPATALGAATGRSLRYWRRDARYLAAVAIMPVLIVFFTLMGLISQPQQYVAIGAVVFVCGMSSISITNELGFDGPAGWVNLTAGMLARPNLAGRIIAMGTFAVPFAVIASVGVPLLFGRPQLIAPVLLGSLGVMLSAWGTSCLGSVLLPYPTAAPGTNPLRDRSSNSAAAMIGTFAAMIGMWIPQLPAIVLAIVGIVLGSETMLLLAGALAVVFGALTLWLCLRGAAAILTRRYVDVFQKVRAFV